MQQQLMADPISRDELREYANIIRKNTGHEEEIYFPVDKFLELVICNPDFFGFELHLPKKYEMPINHGETDPINKTIKIREDVYIGACLDKGRDRFTVAHEVGHALLHCGMLKLNRADPSVTIKTYCDPEWQADAFAGELLIPRHLIVGMSIPEIVRCCRVSYDAAAYQKGIK